MTFERLDALLSAMRHHFTSARVHGRGEGQRDRRGHVVSEGKSLTHFYYYTHFTTRNYYARNSACS